VKYYGGALQYVPEHLKTAELYFEALKQYNEELKRNNIEYDKTYEMGGWYKGGEMARSYLSMKIGSLKSAIEQTFYEMPEWMRDEVRRRLESEGISI